MARILYEQKYFHAKISNTHFANYGTVGQVFNHCELQVFLELTIKRVSFSDYNYRIYSKRSNTPNSSRTWSSVKEIVPALK